MKKKRNKRMPTYRLDAEARCLREHCNLSGPVECGVLSAARPLPTGPEGAMSRRHLASMSRPQNLIGHANSNT